MRAPHFHLIARSLLNERRINTIVTFGNQITGQKDFAFDKAMKNQCLAIENSQGARAI